MVAVSPTTQHPSHHISLSDGVTTIGLILCDGSGRPVNNLAKSGFPRSAMRISQGQTGYGDLEPPFTPAVQSDWSGGRGAEDFDSDTTRYYDSMGVDTTHGDIILGPAETYSSGYFSSYNLSTRNADYTLTGPAGSVKLAASSYTPGAGNIAMRKVRVPLKLVAGQTYPINIRVLLYSDSSGPNTLLASSSYLPVTLTAAYANYDLDISYTLNNGTKYWLAVEVQANKSIVVGRDSSEAGQAIYTKTTGGWSNELNLQALALTILTNASGKAHFFRYRGALYAATAPDDQSAPKVYINGYRGSGADNAADKSKTNTKLNLSGVDLTGKVIKIVAGKGLYEAQNWRVITGNTQTGTNDTITVSPNWRVTQDATTEFIILGCDTWQDVATMTGGAAYASVLKYPVTSVCVSDDVVHIAQGLDAADSYIIDMKQYNNAGTVTTGFRANSTNKARLIVRHVLQTGGKRIWWTWSNNDIRYATAVKYGTNFTVGGTVSCGSEDTNITGLIIYGTPPVLYVFKEDTFGSINNNIYAEVPLSELESVASDYNGRVLLRHDVYLYFSLGEGWERYYNNHLDDLGPNRDEGLPSGRNGPISCTVGYAGRFYVGVDGGDDGYSAVLCYNGLGWHEIYRAPFGKRIRNMYVQVIPGDAVDRLWISEEEDLLWLPITLNPRKDSAYRYQTSGTLVSAWMYGNLKDVRKYYDAARLFTMSLLADHQSVTFEYQTDNEDDDDAWHNAVDLFETSPVQEQDLSATSDTVGRRFRYRLTLATDDTTITPRVTALVLDSVTRLPTKFTYSATFLADDYVFDLQGKKGNATAVALEAQLASWANSDNRAAPLTLHSTQGLFDDRLVFIEPASVRPFWTVNEKKRDAHMIGQFTLIGV